MLRTLNWIVAFISALALTLLLGACQAAPRGADENTSVENVVEEDVNASDENMSMDMNMSMDANTTAAGPADDAEEGLGAFRELSDMEVDNWYTVEFFVAPEGEGPAREAGLARESGNAVLTAPQAVYVAPAMRVTLQEDPNFEIRAKSNPVVITGSDKSATWLWNVRPLTGGERTLYATVEVLQRNPDGSLKKDANGDYVASKPKTRHADVLVKVGTWKGFMIAIQNAATLGDVLGTLFSSWQKTLVALAALIGAASGVWLALRNWGKPKG